MRFIIVCFFAVVCGSAQSLWFEPNQGQAHPSVQFLAHTPGGYIYFAHDKMAVRDVRMDLVGANKHAKAELEEPTGGISSYFIGRDEKDWHTGIPHYGRVRYKNVYAGIDLVYYATGRDIEYDFVLKPGADPNQIKLAYNKPVQIDSNGDLLVASLKQHRPKVFQNGREIVCYYLVRGERVKLALADYDRSQPLTVDPVLEFSTYLGGPAYDVSNALQLDGSGNILLAGTTRAPAAPGVNPFQQTSGLSQVAIVLKMTPTASAVVWFAAIGGTGGDSAYSIAVDRGGAAYVTGQTSSTDFPVTNAVQTTFGGGFQDAFAAKVSSQGSLIYATYLGGSSNETGWGIAVDNSGIACIVGTTASHDFPLSRPLFSEYVAPSGFVAKLSPSGKEFVFSTFLGGKTGQSRGQAVAMDSTGAAYVTGWTSADDFPIKNGFQSTRHGQNAFVTKLAADGGAILSSTFLGGSQFDYGYAIAIDPSGNIYLAGQTSSTDFPLKNAFQPSFGGGYSDVFLAELNATADRLLYATYIGGSGADFPGQVAVDGNGHVYLCGWTGSSDFPLNSSLQAYGGGLYDTFVLELAPATNSLVFSTYLGGNGDDRGFAMSLDPTGSVYMSGVTTSSDFPVKNAFQQVFGGGFGDMFVAKITPFAPVPAPVVTLISPAVVPAGSGDTTIIIAGSGFQNAAVAELADGSLRLPTTLVNTNTLHADFAKALLASPTTYSLVVANPQSAPSNPVMFTVSARATQITAVVNAASFATGPVAPGEIVTIFGSNLDPNVTFDFVPATMVYSSATQVNVTVPYGVTGPTTSVQSGSSAPFKLDVAPSAPGIFAAASAADNILTLYATGCGVLTNDDLPRCALPVSVTVNDQPATVLYAGIAPGLVQGANQINIQLPDGITTSDKLTIVLTAGDASSKPFVWNQP
jgi:uncharacterized protein (TIGR03437 family)